MCRTDFCHLTSSYEHPRLVGFRSVAHLRTRDADNRLFHVSAIRFGGPHDYLRATAAGLVFPSRCVAAEPLTSLSPLPRPSPRSRAVSDCESRRDRLPRVRVNEARERTTRDAFHRARTFAPQRPFERPALAFPCVAALPPRCRLSSPFHSRASFRIRASRAPVHAPLCHWESRFSEPGLRLPTSATFERRAGTPDERSILARERGFRSATRRHQPMPAASASTKRRRFGGLRATTGTRRLDARRVPLAWREQVVGRSARAKADARS
jgi:hypothetical protein